MIKKAMMLLAALFVVVSLSGQQAKAQSDEKKIEVGGHLSLQRVPTFSVSSTGIVCVTIPCPTSSISQDSEIDPGFGARIGYNVTRYLTLEAEGNFFPRDRDVEGGRKVQGLFGAKAGKRFTNAGIFAKARPGFVRLSRGDYRFGTGGCVAVFPPPLACYQPVAKTSFAIDLGGVAEFYPSSHTILRFDVGDTIVRLDRRNAAALSTTGLTGLVVLPVAAETRHQLQVSVGAGFRF
jgi:hypothetical protein